jgi:hypothetical protein
MRYKQDAATHRKIRCSQQAPRKEQIMPSAVVLTPNVWNRVVNGPRQGEDEVRWNQVVNGPGQAQSDEEWDRVVNGPREEEEEETARAA